ncbi:MAG TPA: hypothetical protein VNA30_00680 [Mycobacteriales bacterium]|nr:hypothetical protein [Mycobacteriales bacterium]
MRIGCAVALAGLLAVTGCAEPGQNALPPESRSAPPPASPAGGAPAVVEPAVAAPAPRVVGTAAALPCPTSYAAPDPNRPVLTAAVTVGSRGLVTGTETFVFRPDLATGEIVLRLWGASPRARAAGGSVTVSRVAVNGVPRQMSRPAPTLLRVPLAGKTPAGRPVTIAVDFRLQLPTGASERFGHRGETAWFGSGLPLLPWARGRGWATEPETANFAEAATSEAMELASLSVTRPSGLGVLATGAQVSDDGSTAVFRARSVRDLAVAVGRFRVARATTAHNKEVVVGVAPEVRDDPVVVAREMGRAVRAHASRFGPFPYERLVTAVLPDIRGGIEFPGMVLLGTGQAQGDATGSHEVAHEWWYGLVGNNQGRDPWLDEAFGTWAEALDRGTGASYIATTIPADGRNRVGAPMTYWEGRSSYYRSVYIQGAVALLKARSRVGAAAFDSAMTCHVRRNAHRITTPADIAASLRHLPAAVTILQSYGALPR